MPNPLDEVTDTGYCHFYDDCVVLDGVFKLEHLETLVAHIKQHGYKDTRKC